jgi:DNA-binding response OmpR family regulator
MLCRIPRYTSRTLIVEDDPVLRAALAGLLRLKGFIVHSACTLHDALDKLHLFLPNRVILDIRLPDGCGLELLRRVREHDLPARIAVVTGEQDLELMREIRLLKPELLMIKPFEIEPLLEFLQ